MILKEIQKIDIKDWYLIMQQVKNFIEEQEYMEQIKIGYTILFKMILTQVD